MKRHQLSRRLSLLAAAVLAVLVASCGGGPKPYPCKGVLRVNGQPAGNARVVFHHVQGWEGRTIVPMAWTAEDGSFELTTFQPGDGAPEGEYEVVVSWPQYRGTRGDEGPDRLQGRFANPKSSNLRVRVEPRANEVPLDLNAPVAPASKVAKADRRKRR